MAETATEESQAVTEVEMNNPSMEDMEIETPNAAEETGGDAVENGDEPNSKRAREDEGAKPDENGGAAKKQKVEKSPEEERLEKLEGAERKQEEPARVCLGPKSFGSSVEMFDYFYKLLHFWTVNLNLNKYEHMVLLDLLKKGHLEPDKKIGMGIHAFQVRFHPDYRSRCFFVIRDDGSIDDLSFRKCVDHLLPLPEHLKLKSEVNKALGGKSGGRGGRGQHGRGRGRGGRRG